MELWNFCHSVLHAHVWYVFAIVLAVIMAVAFLIQRKNQKKRDEENESILGEQQEDAAPGKETKEADV